MTAKYSVDYWGSHPEEGHDDCYCGADFDTLEEAEEEYAKDPNDSSVAYVEMCEYVGEAEDDVREVVSIKVRQNPNYKPEQDNNDDDWRNEIAMEAGMLHGVDAWNEVMGCDLEYDD